MIYENRMKNEQFPFKCAVMRGNMPFMNHCHQEVEVLVIRNGCLKVEYEERKYVLHQGDIWMSPPFASHSIGTGYDNCERLAILMDIKMIGTWTKDETDWLWIQDNLYNRDLCSQSWNKETIIKVRGIIDKLHKEYTEKEYAWQLAAKTLVNELMLTAVREMPKKEKVKDINQISKIKDILEYIALHYCEELSLQACADTVGFNATYLSRYFSRHMGMTYQQYVKQLRIDKAKWLLMTEKIQITEICYQSGFHDIKTFNKLFRQMCKMSPTEFRRHFTGQV